MGNECCFQGALTGISTVVSNEATEMADKSSASANKHIGSLAGEEKEEDKIDSAFEKVMATGNDLIFNSKKTLDQHKRDKIRTKNKKQMESIRNKYHPPAAPVKKLTSKDRQSYEDIKSRLKG
mmetsp:Transcript_117225/g.175098  ORF Transcript_117225/g.175098 Transcript_117225/m.175098 type:complete len:123 (+) Transcript_117225:26-394(+)